MAKSENGSISCGTLKQPYGFDFLPKLKVGKFSQSPKVCFPNVEFFDTLIVKFDSEAVEKP
jgi:hypothetical protein